MSKLRVLVIDDLPLARQVISNALATDPEIEVVGTAPDARFAREKIERLAPDVITLDVDLPDVDGLSFLRALLVSRPLPTVVVSALTPAGGTLALRALQMGAIDVMAKPDRSLQEVGEEFALQLVDKVKAAARARFRRPARPSLRSLPPGAPVAPASLLTTIPPATSGTAAPPAARMSRPPVLRPRSGAGEPVILLGASTGGCEALHAILSGFPEDAPPVVCVQHIPAQFSTALAAQLDATCRLRVHEARYGDLLERGCAYLAPGGRHLVLRDRHAPRLEVRDGPLVNRHRPAIDLTFSSAAELLGSRAVAALLTGMGEDGVAGLLAIRAAGGFTLAQDEASSQIFGMPKEAIERGAAMTVAPLGQIARILLREAARRRS
jgi:two-component system chemotaxis response regulator CheB